MSGLVDDDRRELRPARRNGATALNEFGMMTSLAEEEIAEGQWFWNPPTGRTAMGDRQNFCRRLHTLGTLGPTIIQLPLDWHLVQAPLYQLPARAGHKRSKSNMASTFKAASVVDPRAASIPRHFVGTIWTVSLDQPPTNWSDKRRSLPVSG